MRIKDGLGFPLAARLLSSTEKDGCSPEGKSRHLDPSGYSEVMSFEIPKFSLSSWPSCADKFQN
jgi:hypothetical protein